MVPRVVCVYPLPWKVAVKARRFSLLRATEGARLGQKSNLRSCAQQKAQCCWVKNPIFDLVRNRRRDGGSKIQSSILCATEGAMLLGQKSNLRSCAQQKA